MSEGNGNDRIPIEILDAQYRVVADRPTSAVVRPRRRQRLWPSLTLFLFTLASTLMVGMDFAESYSQNVAPFSGSTPIFSLLESAWHHPSMLLLGVPFSFTLLLILLSHELGHFFAGRHYGIDVSYPYFIPAPTLFGTFGAVISIRSPIPTRKALFDVGIAGPVVGFAFAVPAMAWAVATAKIVPDAQANAAIHFGNPPLILLLDRVFHPGVDTSWILLGPVGWAAWVGLLATAMNLLPMWQLDGGHIVYSLTSRHHQRISLAIGLALIALGVYSWPMWALWGIILLALSLRFGHPPLLNSWEPLGTGRQLLALLALAILALSFTPLPAH
ncbi:MAG: site-2 protease family protein [Acidobacteriota bacterium]|nr:site-2 protease family protein [Acidobacteriota bacterium]